MCVTCFRLHQGLECVQVHQREAALPYGRVKGTVKGIHKLDGRCGQVHDGVLRAIIREQE